MGVFYTVIRPIGVFLPNSVARVACEPIGKIDTQDEKDSIRTSLKNLGRLKDYHHGSNATYNVPFNKLPLTDFVSGSVRYGAEYNWTGRDLVLDSVTKEFIDDKWGNTISNSQTWTYNASLTLNTLYNKIPFLKKINTPAPPIQFPPADTLAERITAFVPQAV